MGEPIAEWKVLRISNDLPYIGDAFATTLAHVGDTSNGGAHQGKEMLLSPILYIKFWLRFARIRSFEKMSGAYLVAQENRSCGNEPLGNWLVEQKNSWLL